MAISRDTILLGQFASVTAHGEDAAGNRAGGTPVLTSVDTAIATIDPTGLVTPRRVGLVSINASLGTLSGQVSVRVGPSIQLKPQLPSLFVGDTLHMSATVFDGLGSTSGLPVTFIARTPAIASVSADGVVTGNSPGTVTVVAKVDVATDSVLVAVLPVRLGGNGPIVAACTILWRLCRYGDATTDTLPLRSQPLMGYSPSPDGRRLAITYRAEGNTPGQLWVTDADGLGGVAVSTSYVAGWPAWSPDATQIAVEGSTDGQAFITYLDRTPEYKLVVAPPEQMSQPTFSPDGRRIAFLLRGKVWVLALGRAEAPVQLHLPGTALEFSWSPDGRWLAVSTRGFDGPDIITWWAGVWLVRPDDTGLRPFSPNCGPGPSCTNGPSFQQPTWSPDGRAILMWGTTFSGVGQPSLPPSFEARSVATREFLGSLVHPFLAFPGWSPDGQRVVWLGQDEGSTETALFTSNVTGGDIRRLATGVTGRPIWMAQP